MTWLLDANVLSQAQARRRQPAAGAADGIAAAPPDRLYARPLPVIDALIAAAARVHSMSVVTPEVRSLEPAGIEVFNPFAE